MVALNPIENFEGFYYSSNRISIHAPLAGSDISPTARDAPSRNFNPRSPCGERPCRTRYYSEIPVHFNPRSPCGERPGIIHPIEKGHIIFQSTLPLRGATAQYRSRRASTLDFNPRSPCGERPLHIALLRCLMSRYAELHPVLGVYQPLENVYHASKRCEPHAVILNAPCSHRPPDLVR